MTGRMISKNGLNLPSDCDSSDSIRAAVHQSDQTLG